MDQELAKYFFEEVSEALHFLESEHSFSAPQLHIDEKIHFAFVIFMGKNLAVECILDERESDVTCKVARVVAGQKTTHYARDDSGKRVREGIWHNLLRRGREFPLRSGKNLTFRQQIKVVLSNYASMLKEYGEEILNDSATALD